MRCLAHIVNLVVKVILRQFDVKKKKVKKDQPEPDNNIPDLAGGNDDEDNDPEATEEEVEEAARVLDKEEKEMDEGDEGEDEESDKLVRDVEKLEEVMGEEIDRASKMVKPVRQVLFKVSALFYLCLVAWIPWFSAFLFF